MLRIFPWLVLALTSPVALAAAGPVTEIQYLSGIDKDHPVEWEFFCTEGRWCGFPTVIGVPSNWELQGFGRYDYGFHDGKRPEEGRYRYRFEVPAGWAERQVDLVFGGVMTDAEVHLNGELAGPVHQGGFTEFRYDVTDLLDVSGKNLLEVTVREASADASVNRAERDADYWLFGGIYRPVFLEARPRTGIRRLAVDADFDGSLAVKVTLQGVDGAVPGLRVLARLFPWIEDAAGESAEPVGQSLERAIPAGAGRVRLEGRFAGIEPWTAETPNLYRLEVALESPEGVLHRVEERIGFRTVEVRAGLGLEQSGLFINGRKSRLKGINRHSFWPSSGRATSRAISELDARLIRQMNLNAVRTSHYPPDPHFLEVCDEVGLYVLLELPGWHDAYDTEVGSKLVQEMVLRDRNHPSVILWSNGNEGGWNARLDPFFDRLDPQDRPLLHPDSDRPFRGLNTLHYRNYTELRQILYHEGLGGWWAELWGEPDLYLTTEYLHGLYDGGHGAGLREFWDAIRGAPNGVGGFLWAFVDEGVVRTDEEGRIDTFTNYAPDGVVGPYREREASFFTLRRIFSPILLEAPERLPRDFDGRLPVSNEYHFTDLADVHFRWRLLRLEPRSVLAEGEGTIPSTPPGGNGILALDPPLDPALRHNAGVLEIVALDTDGEAVNEWMLPFESLPAPVASPGESTCREEEDGLRLLHAESATEVTLDRRSGELLQILVQGRRLPLTEGPRFGPDPAKAGAVRCGDSGDALVRSAGPLEEARWRIVESGGVEMTYRYRADGLGPAHGPGFTLPRESVQSLRWRGRGPYRVWANRLEGPLFGVWSVEANDTRTGVDWTLPEFTGFFAAPQWIEWHLESGALVVAVDGAPFFQNFHPGVPIDPRFTVTPMHPSSIAFLHGISGIGTKFHPTEELRPAASGAKREGFEGRVVFRLVGSPSIDSSTE